MVTPRLEEHAGGGVARPEAERRGRQQHGHHPGGGQGPGVVVVGVDQVVGAGAAQLGGQEGAAGVGQLLGVDPGDEAVGPARLQRLAGFLHRQCPDITEGVAGARGPAPLQPAIRVIPGGGPGGRPEVGQVPGPGPPGHGPQDLEEAPLGFGVEAVAHLASRVVVPWYSVDSARRQVSSTSSSVVAARVAATEVMIPPVRYRSPARRARCSRARSPAKARWVRACAP